MRKIGKENTEPEKEDRQREPLDAAEIVGDFGLWRRINGLKKSFAEDSVINDRAVDEPIETRRAVDLASPLRRAGRSEKDQMLETQERLGFAITFLLFKKGAQGKAAIVPDDRGRAKPDHAAGLLEPPAKIDIVAGRMIFGVEAADIFKRPSVERHVTTGNVFRDGVGKQNMARSAGRGATQD